MSIEAVVAGERSCYIEACSAPIFLAKIPRRKVRLVFSSPPYALKMHRYGTQEEKGSVEEWIELLFRCSVRAVSATAGPVMWVVNSPFDGGQYHPAVEGLIWRWYTATFGDCVQDRPCIWHKNSAPSRQGKWFTNDWESILCFGDPDAREVWEPERIATKPLYTSGGAFRQRGGDGKRREGGDYPTNKLTNPRDVRAIQLNAALAVLEELDKGPEFDEGMRAGLSHAIDAIKADIDTIPSIHRATVGGGHMGYGADDDKFTKESEAPFPVKLVEPFVLALTNPGDIVCDPFCGSGTVARVCLEHGRRFIGCDLREEQVEIATMRLQAAVLNKTDLGIWTPRSETNGERDTGLPPQVASEPSEDAGSTS